MIRVSPAPEPRDFHAKVREPGLNAIAELIGEIPRIRRTGPERRKAATTPGQIPPENFPPFWRRCLDDLLYSYHRICAYTCLYIPRGTGAPTVDHLIPRSAAWNLIYEWSNYRLACSLMNSRKGAAQFVLDPFEVGDDWFGLEFTGHQVLAREGLAEEIRLKVEQTIEKLKLNDEECRLAREEYAESYRSGEIPLEFLERRAPFTARELRRQGLLRTNVDLAPIGE